MKFTCLQETLNPALNTVVRAAPSRWTPGWAAESPWPARRRASEMPARAPLLVATVRPSSASAARPAATVSGVWLGEAVASWFPPGRCA